MTKARKVARKVARKRLRRRSFFWRVFSRLFRFCVYGLVVVVLLVTLFGVVNPPRGFYMRSEATRLGVIKQDWVAIEDFSIYMPLSVVAAEDANFCLHKGFDIDAIREALEDGGTRGASTISQQVAKNVFLWHGRTWVRKGLEVVFTGLIEVLWSKRRIVEVYLNVAEFDEGVFGAAAGAQHYFGSAPDRISATQAARLASILPSPKTRSASKPSRFIRNKTARVMSGAGTILADGRADCFTKR